jgi:hypothetical protein
VLERFLSGATGAEKTREAAELEYLLNLLERDGTRMPGTERRWADILGRFIRDDYNVPTGRRKHEVRDRRLSSRHYWLTRQVFPNLGEDNCADSVARVYADAGSKLSASRIKRIAKTAQNRSAAVQWIEGQVNAFANHAPDVVVRALLATFEPIAADRKLLAALSRHEVK